MFNREQQEEKKDLDCEDLVEQEYKTHNASNIN